MKAKLFIEYLKEFYLENYKAYFIAVSFMVLIQTLVLFINYELSLQSFGLLILVSFFLILILTIIMGLILH